MKSCLVPKLTSGMVGNHLFPLPESLPKESLHFAAAMDGNYSGIVQDGSMFGRMLDPFKETVTPADYVWNSDATKS